MDCKIWAMVSIYLRERIHEAGAERSWARPNIDDLRNAEGGGLAVLYMVRLVSSAIAIAIHCHVAAAVRQEPPNPTASYSLVSRSICNLLTSQRTLIAAMLPTPMHTQSPGRTGSEDQEFFRDCPRIGRG